MAHLTILQKHARFAMFFLALSQPQHARRMARVGFSGHHFRRAWELIGRSAEARLGRAEPSVALGDKLAALVELERAWMPVVQTTLEIHHPALHAELIGNYQRVSGAVLVPLVQEVLARIEGLGKSPDAERRQARALLAERGVTPSVVAQFHAAIAEALAIEPSDPASDDAEQRVAEADEAMWSFYLEWSRLARAVITDRLSLRQLGFLRTRKRAERDEPALAGQSLDF